jgi:signal transduction histidine kinase
MAGRTSKVRAVCHAFGGRHLTPAVLQELPAAAESMPPNEWASFCDRQKPRAFRERYAAALAKCSRVNGLPMSLRARVFLTLALLLFLLAVLGSAGVVLLHRLGGRIDAILRENYDSVRAMERLNEAAERIDSSFRLALAGRKEEKGAHDLYDASWRLYEEQLDIEKKNITILPEEERLVKELQGLTDDYQDLGDRFFRRPADDPARKTDYSGTGDRPGLESLFQQIKAKAAAILQLNQKNMEDASRDAKETARVSIMALAVTLAAASVLALLLVWQLVHSVLRPLRKVTLAAHTLGTGHFDFTVPVHGNDEIGQLARTFNAMTDRLRVLRHSNLQQLLRAQQTGQATIDSFSDPILVVEPEGRVEMANLAARQVLGVTTPPEGRQDTRPDLWIPPEPLRQPLANALREQRPYLTESFDQVLFLRLGGEDRAYLPQIRPIRDSHGETLGAAVVLSDVTRFRLLDQLKTNLVATASHELKTPLSGLRLALHFLLEENVGPLTPKQTELLLDARDNAERLLNLIEHFLVLARLEHGAEALHREREDPVALLRAAADNVAARAQDKHIALIVAEDGSVPPVAADAVRLEYALNNLLDNALTYTPPGGRVTLFARAVGNDKVRLSVADTGVGIPAEHLPYVFEKFFRVPNTAHPPGTGLGLAIVREIVLAHDGLITCESQPGKGTVFHLTLPVWKDYR